MIGSVFLKQYQAVSFLGKGSMGSVFLARHLTKPEVVVVKVMNREYLREPAFRKLFDREIESLTRLRHPCIVGLLGSDFNDPNGPCLVMEFIPGITLETLLQRHKALKPDQIFRLLVPLCRALAYGHARQVTHRDLKPANLMVLDPDTAHESVKVMDFGLAHIAAKPHIPLAKLRGANVADACGTPIYVAPEGLRGDPVDHRADLYSVGVILYELLTGVPPFLYSDAMALLHAHVHDRPPRFAQVRRDLKISPDVESVVRRCLEKFPHERPQTAREIAKEFGQALGLPLTEELFPREEAEAASVPPSSEFKAAKIVSNDPNAQSSQFDAYMPEPIAVVKLRGFVDDAGGQILESEPGRIRVQFGERQSPVPSAGGGRSLRSLFGRPASAATLPAPGPEPIEMVLFLERKAKAASNCLELTVTLKPLDGTRLSRPVEWRSRCDQLLKEMKAYMMAK